jgi:hypothetical protein
MADRREEDGMRLLRAIEEEHSERREGQPLQALTPVVPEAAAPRVGLEGERYEEAARWLEEQNAIEGDERTGDVGGKRMYLITSRGVEMLGGGRP